MRGRAPLVTTSVRRSWMLERLVIRQWTWRYPLVLSVTLVKMLLKIEIL